MPFASFWGWGGTTAPQLARASSFTRFLDNKITHNDAPQLVGLLWTSD